MPARVAGGVPCGRRHGGRSRSPGRDETCFIDEAGDLGALAEPPRPNDQPVPVIGGPFVDAVDLVAFTSGFLALKQRHFPNPPLSLAQAARPYPAGNQGRRNRQERDPGQRAPACLRPSRPRHGPFAALRDTARGPHPGQGARRGARRHTCLATAAGILRPVRSPFRAFAAGRPSGTGQAVRGRADSRLPTGADGETQEQVAKAGRIEDIGVEQRRRSGHRLLQAELLVARGQFVERLAAAGRRLAAPGEDIVGADATVRADIAEGDPACVEKLDQMRP